MGTIRQTIGRGLTRHGVLWMISGLGILLRMRQYWANRSLWLDEALLANHVLGRSFGELAKPQDWFGAEPLGFLWGVKSLVLCAGDHEYVLRLFPLVAGIVSVFFFHHIAVRILAPRAALWALILFAFSNPLIYYSSEFKQYSCDVFFSLLLYRILMGEGRPVLTAARLLKLALAGLAALWFSHAVIFVLAGIAAGLLLTGFDGAKSFRQILAVMLLLAGWAVLALFYYTVVLGRLEPYQAILGAWSYHFPPGVTHPLKLLRWLFWRFFEIFFSTGGFVLQGLSGLVFLTGVVAFLKEKPREAFFLLCPVFFAALASGFGKYPLHGRFLLFFLPGMLLFMGEGVEVIRSVTKTRIHGTVGWALVMLVLFQPLTQAAHAFFMPRTREEIKGAMNYIRSHWQEGDYLYVYYGATPAFLYYARRFDFDGKGYGLGMSRQENFSGYLKELDGLTVHERVWVLFSHMGFLKGRDERQLFEAYLDHLGRKVLAFRKEGAAAALYRFPDRGKESAVRRWVTGSVPPEAF